MNIDLTDEQLERMTKVNKNWANIEKLLDADVFNLKNGRAILDFDSGGNIANIQKVLNYHFKIIKIL